jgi:hypothetical protein
MTRHKATQTGLATPSPLDHWINAMLRGLAMLVSHVARRLAPKRKTQAEAFVRSVVRDTFHQKVDEKTIKSVAVKVAKVAALEATEDEPERKRA